MKSLKIIFLLLFGLGAVSANWDANFHLFKAIHDGKFSNVTQQLHQIERGFEDISRNFINILLGICEALSTDASDPMDLVKKYLPEAYNEIVLNEDDDEGEPFGQACLIHTIELVRQGCRGTPWALLMIDSWAKIQSGFLSGNIRNPGMFTQCIRINGSIESDYTNFTDVKGKYVLMGVGAYVPDSLNRSIIPEWIRPIFPEEPLLNIGAFIPPGLPLFVDIGLCVPDVCDNDIVMGISRIITFLLGLGPTELTSNNVEAFFQTRDQPPFGAMEWGAVSLIILGFAGVILSTIYEVICVKLQYKPSEMTAAMSLYSNGKYLFTMRKKKDHVQALYGIRALSLIWLMLGYRFIVPLIVPLVNPLAFALDFLESYFSPWVFASQFGVDAILFANATLITFLFMCKMEKSGHWKVWKMYIYRLMRVTPFIGILIFFMMTLTPYQGGGPYYKFLTEMQIPACEEYWWSAMFHVQNYVNPDTLCLLHTYMFSIDMQLYWAAPLILFPLFFFGSFFMIFIFVLLCLVVACATTTAYYRAFLAFFPNMIVHMEHLMSYLRMIFFATHIRMGPWLIGVLCGYIVFRLKNGKRKINWFLSAFFWLVSISGIIAVVYLLYPFYQIFEDSPSQPAHYMYIGFARNIFALCLAWFVIGSFTGTGGVIAWILELSIWQPISKMQISIYIVSLSAQMVMVATWKTPYVFGIGEMLQAFQGDVLIVLLFSTVTFLTIERPICRTMKGILRIGQKKQEEDEEEVLKFEKTEPWKSFY